MRAWLSGRRMRIALGAFAASSCLLALATWGSLTALPDALSSVTRSAERLRIVDRSGNTLSFSYQNRWNSDEQLALHEIPQVLRDAFLLAEDQRFFTHYGVDWRARASALVQNLEARRVVRGGSTISEQVVRILQPRPRTLWSRWVEGFEALRLERRFAKAEILEFYLNQVPYANQRRGVVQAARYYFDRDLTTLNLKETLALAVLVRSPSRLDLRRNPQGVERASAQLAARMQVRGLLTEQDVTRLATQTLELREPSLEVMAPHFVSFVRTNLPSELSHLSPLHTTLDGALQATIQKLLDEKVRVLEPQQVSRAAALVLDHRTNEVLAWVNAGEYSAEIEGSMIDAVVTPRQPGSTLKPFLYALAMEEHDFTAATRIDDSPLVLPVGQGLHSFRNYSRVYRGPIRLREALGNSLNVPAVRTNLALAPGEFHGFLRRLGFVSLTRPAAAYGEGLALGNGEVTLRELVTAYAVLARGGVATPLRWWTDQNGVASDTESRRILSEEVASIVADILADPAARALEFGRGGILEFPVETAVKTGTSDDYRDAWALGFSDRYTAGVWMGNFDRAPMRGVSGAVGSALVLRAIFAELRRFETSEALPRATTLERVNICSVSGELAGATCPRIAEWFRPGTAPKLRCARHAADATQVAARTIRSDAENLHAVRGQSSAYQWVQPTPGLHLALDPRIPDELEVFEFEVAVAMPAEVARKVIHKIEWFVDDAPIATTGPNVLKFAWPVTRGTHHVAAAIWEAGATHPHTLEPVEFLVK